METLALEELQEKWALHFPESTFPQANISLGGVEVMTTLELGFSLNYILKIPGRILLRLDSFKCRDFPKLFKKLKKIPWNNYLLGQIPIIKSSSKKSRIFDSRKIEKTAQDAIKAYYLGQAPKKKSLEKLKNAPEMSIFLRIEDDTCLLSLDTSGERLHRRGLRTLIGAAPLRENLAAGMVYFLKKNAPIDLAYLIDPMCGSGTLLLEALEFYKTVTTRKFAFEYFPLKTNLPILKIPDITLFKNYIGMDKDPSVIEAAKSNQPNVKFITEDLFSGVSTLENAGIIFNPPYGKRIELDKSIDEIMKRVKEKFSPKIIGILIPEETPKSFKAKNVLSFSNGGIRVKFYLL